MTSIQEKYLALKNALLRYGKVAVAYSGGVDSSLLSFVAHEALGDDAIAVTADAPMVPRSEFSSSKAFCQQHGIKQVVVGPNPFASDIVRFNQPLRCYECKKLIFGALFEAAKENGIDVIADGSNLDDLGDYRPGMKALEEMQVKSPLREAGFTKADIRELSRELGLSTWNKQSNACLATRFPYGAELTQAGFEMVDRAEASLAEFGFSQLRVRVHGEVARIEVPESQMNIIINPEIRNEVVRRLKDAGFAYVALDLAGYRTGSMNEQIGK